MRLHCQFNERFNLYLDYANHSDGRIIISLFTRARCYYLIIKIWVIYFVLKCAFDSSCVIEQYQTYVIFVLIFKCRTECMAQQ